MDGGREKLLSVVGGAGGGRDAMGALALALPVPGGLWGRWTGTNNLYLEMFTFECQTWNHNSAPKFEPWDFSTEADSVLQLFLLVARVHGASPAAEASGSCWPAQTGDPVLSLHGKPSINCKNNTNKIKETARGQRW